ncbi:YjzC family protein [Halobacillus rhizosphaerae]|uniref:YjzC family protein n=1 Tax=Halobacillus rhizosphaerae TaxID=3064889 RepID=UPI00398A7C2F
MDDRRYQTGDEAPKSGIYKLESLMNGAPSKEDNIKVKVDQGEKLPPSPISKEPAYWVRGF